MSQGISTIGILGFGEVGSRLLEDLLAQNDHRLVLWDKQFVAEDSRASERLNAIDSTHRVSVASSAQDMAAQCDLIISAVTASQALHAAGDTLPGIRAGAYYMDVNSVSPETKKAMGALINPHGGRFIEASIMSPIDPKRIASPMLLAGPHSEEFAPIINALGFAGAEVCAAHYGVAAATKMCRSVMIKGMEALVTESLLAAKYYGVEDAVLGSLNNLFPRPDWPEHARYLISRSIEHGVRRAEEMREVANTVADSGQTPWMSSACVERQDWAPQFTQALQYEDLHDMLTAMRAHMDAN